MAKALVRIQQSPLEVPSIITTWTKRRGGCIRIVGLEASNLCAEVVRPQPSTEDVMTKIEKVIIAMWIVVIPCAAVMVAAAVKFAWRYLTQ
jgi:hypothetical protein